MPTTVNGIGTHYYGKKDRAARSALCNSCGRVGTLESYNTRLWFVIFFIPILPLGRKRIIDACPFCRRHYAADADKYEQARQLQISGSQERFRREGTPESALEAHAQLLGFHEHTQAAELRNEILRRFPTDAPLRAALANHMRQTSSFDEMARLNEEALKLDPELSEARIGVAVWKSAQGFLDEARGLLDFLEEPGAGQHYDLRPLYTLAQNYQKAGRHHETLELAAVLLREAPTLAQQHEFRKIVQKSERAVHSPESLLPAREHSVRGLFLADGSPYSQGQRMAAIGATALVLATGGLFASNEYIRRHRTIRVLNACGAPVHVHVDQEKPVVIGESGNLVVAEGKHHIRVSGSVEETRDVEIGSGYFERWTHSPLWVLNPGGEAVLSLRTVIYAVNPIPTSPSLIVGNPFISLPHVDYPFTEVPQSLSVKNRNAEVTKIAVSWVRGEDNAAFLSTEESNHTQALDFAEHRLRRNPETRLLNSYLRETFGPDRARAEAFFKAGLGRKPLSIPWHRAYQVLADHDGGLQALVAQYDALLAQDPTNAGLIYLRGRIDPDPNRKVEFYQRSIAADPNLAWAHMGLGASSLDLGRWDDAYRHLRQAQDLKFDDPLLVRMIHTARLALGQAETLVGEYRGKLSGTLPNDLAIIIELFDALAASGHPEQIEPELMGWEARLPMELRMPANNMLRPFALYQAGRPEDAAQISRNNVSRDSSYLLTESLVATGHSDQAAADPAAAKLEYAWSVLSIAQGLALEGRDDDAKSWREKACALLDLRGSDDHKAATFIRAATAPSLEEIDAALLQPGERALLLVVLAERFPEKRMEYCEAAARFNILRTPPYLLVRRAIEQNIPAKP
jgi:tetratricopeptide (TPR) repeat protein